MSPAHVLEPTYQAIKTRLIEGRWNPGHRLEAGLLADDLHVSITPVRDSLNRLVGERLVDAVAGEGFRVPLIQEAQYRDLLDINQMLLAHSVRQRQGPVSAEPKGNIVELQEHLFLTLLASRANSELLSIVRNLNARLFIFRSLDEQILPDAREQLDSLWTLARAGTQSATLVASLSDFHDARRERASEYVQALRDQPKPDSGL